MAFYVTKKGWHETAGEGVKSVPLSCGLTTHLRVARNFGSRGRALRGFSTASTPSVYPARVSLKGAQSRVLRGPEERGSLSREEIVFPPPGRKFSCRSRRVSCMKRYTRTVGCIAGYVGACVTGINLEN